jgi:hypothetical protein
MTVSELTSTGAERATDLLREWLETSRAWAAREAEFLKEQRMRRGSVDRKGREAVKAAEAKVASRRSAVEGKLAAEEAAMTAHYERRRQRLAKAVTQMQRKLPAMARHFRENRLGSLQMAKRRAQRDHDVVVEAAVAELARAEESLSAQENEVLAPLEVSLRKLGKVLPAGEAPEGQDADALFVEGQRAARAAAESLRQAGEAGVSGVFRAVPLAGRMFKGDAYRQSDAAVQAAAAGLAKARACYRRCRELVQERCGRAREEAAAVMEACGREVQSEWAGIDAVESAERARLERKVAGQTQRLGARVEEIFAQRTQRLHAKRLAAEQETETVAEPELAAVRAAASAELEAEETAAQAAWAAFEAEWESVMGPMGRRLAMLGEAPALRALPWTEVRPESWEPPVAFPAAASIGSVALDLAAVPGALPQQLRLPGPSAVRIPLPLVFPARGCLVLESGETCAGVPMDIFSNVILRLLTVTPPGKLALTILDPVGLGQSFAGFMHLGDYEPTLINRRIWTQRDQIEERLGELNDHIEKVIQMYLRNEYATITEYNREAGTTAEKYHFLVIADFPAGFSEVAVQRLQSIAVSGPRCGVFTLLHHDTRLPVPEGFSVGELRAASVCLSRGGTGSFAVDAVLASAGAEVSLDPPPPAGLAVELVHRIGRSSIDSNRIEVPFRVISPAVSERWKAETASELRVAIGRTGATKLQYLAIGKGTRQHALFAGKTGSGKSTLFHVIITNLALTCSPDEVEFYLIDFKKGVEFKCYADAKLPHAKVIAIESDREFGLSVLQRVDEELRRRGDIFRRMGVQDVAGFKRAGGEGPMPRSLLIIDEFQEFFVEDDSIAQSASVLFDRIVRQGRAFGIHVLLGSQTLGGAYTLARATLGQMAIRVALQCNEADAYLIMDENNPAPRLLTRPGEGIYNDAAGAIEGNSPFQVVWLSDQEREGLLRDVRGMAEEKYGVPAEPIVFEGNAPADVSENPLLSRLLEAPRGAVPVAPRCWFGAPNSIKGPTEAVFHRQSGNHLLMVGQREEAALVMMGVALVALAAQYPAGGVRLVLLHQAVAGSVEEGYVERIAAAVPELRVGRGPESSAILAELAEELRERSGGEGGASVAVPVFLLVHGLQRFRKLRSEDDFSFGGGGDSAGDPAAQFTELVTEGSIQGIHLIISVDTAANAGRYLNRKAMAEFEMRILFQMSANDSARMIDSPAAQDLGLYRALLYNEQAGTVETFRPYAMPPVEWTEAVGLALKKS